MFQPPRCPNPGCAEHHSPRSRFFRRNGRYHPKCRAHAVPRFLCRSCGRGFSRQTFRMDYRDHRPHLNTLLFGYLTSGIGLRQSARLLGLSRRCTELKFHKIARHLRHLNLNLRGPLPPSAELQFDELETYEGRRNTRPLTLPILIEPQTRFMIWAECAPIRPRGRMSTGRERAIAEDRERLGVRRDESRESILRTLRRGADLTRGQPSVQLSTDEKSTYPSLARQVFGRHRLLHQQTNSKLARGTWNPLFPINHTEAMARDLVGRLRRESWLVSKKGKYLDLQLQIYMAYRNYQRPRFNRDWASPARMLGFVDERVKPRQLLGWRQDWSERSVHPLACGNESVAGWRPAARAA